MKPRLWQRFSAAVRIRVRPKCAVATGVVSPSNCVRGISGALSPSLPCTVNSVVDRCRDDWIGASASISG
jgi:hypothetical protein